MDRRINFLRAHKPSAHTHLSARTRSWLLSVSHTRSHCLTWCPLQINSLPTIPRLLTFYTVFVSTLSLCPFSSLGSDSKIHKGFRSWIMVRRGEERRVVVYTLTMFPMTETFPFLSVSLLSGSSPLMKCSWDLYLFLPPYLFSVSLTWVQFSMYYWQEYYMKHIAKVSKYYTGKALWGTTLLNQSKELLWSYDSEGTWLIDALSSPEVSWWGVGWQWGLSGGTGSQQIWCGEEGVEETTPSDRTLVLFHCGLRGLNKEQAGERQQENDC